MAESPIGEMLTHATLTIPNIHPQGSNVQFNIGADSFSAKDLFDKTTGNEDALVAAAASIKTNTDELAAFGDYKGTVSRSLPTHGRGGTTNVEGLCRIFRCNPVRSALLTLACPATRRTPCTHAHAPAMLLLGVGEI